MELEPNTKLREWQVKERWGIDKLKLAEYVWEEGLPAYDQYGRKIPTVEMVVELNTIDLRNDLEKQKEFIADQITYFISDDVLNFEYDHGIKPTPTKESTPAPQTEPQAENYFKRNGATWTICFEGKESKPINHVNGLLYIAYLLDSPRTSMDSLKLYNTVSYKPPDKITDESAAIGEGFNIGSRKQKINDEEAINAYWKKWNECQNNIDEAPDTPEGDMIKKENLQQQKELERLLDERNFADDHTKKQTLIHGLLKTAYKNIQADHNMKKCVDYLKKQIKTDGAHGFIYNGEIEWKIFL